MRYFTSDLHLGDERLTLYGRQLCVSSAEEMNQLLIYTWNRVVQPADEVWMLGDICYTPESLPLVAQLNGTKHLVRGNYDAQFSNAELDPYFATICDDVVLYIGDEPVYLNHYPIKCYDGLKNNGYKLGLAGHTHGLWKVKRNIINVSCDAWHFTPISEDLIKFQINGIRNHYDENVFLNEIKGD